MLGLEQNPGYEATKQLPLSLAVERCALDAETGVRIPERQPEFYSYVYQDGIYKIARKTFALSLRMC